MLLFTLLLTHQFSVIMEKISEATGKPAGKEKLPYEGIFTEDSNLLASFNMANGAVVC